MKRITVKRQEDEYYFEALKIRHRRFSVTLQTEFSWSPYIKKYWFVSGFQPVFLTHAVKVVKKYARCDTPANVLYTTDLHIFSQNFSQLRN